MQLDKDLQSIQQARDLAKRAYEAHLEFKQYSQEQVDAIVKAMVDAGFENAELLAKKAVEESGFGKWEDKVLKNQLATRDVWESIKDLKTVGVIGSEAGGKILKVAEPMGVVAALVPSTNPTSTAIFKAIIALKARNGIVASPHPRTVNCTREALEILDAAAVKADAPKGLIQCMTVTTQEGTQALMSDRNTGVILATGSTPMVRAAYSSGKPAYGVGSGNVPAFIERTADYKKAVADIIYGTTFDNGTLCSSEQSMIVDNTLREKVIEEAKAQGAYFVNAEEKKKLENAVQKGGKINPEIVGQPAAWIASYAGFSVPSNTTVLIAECSSVGKQEPLSMEKLSPMLAFYTVDGWLEGCHTAIDLLKFGGIGHTMAIHSNDTGIIMKFALEKPAFRILVNTVSSVGAVGYTTALNPSMTLGCGTWGGSIVSENVSAKHLMNVKFVAFETNPINRGRAVNAVEASGTGSSFMRDIEERLRARAGNAPTDPLRSTGPAPNTAKKSAYGAGISETEIEKIIKDFRVK